MQSPHPSTKRERELLPFTLSINSAICLAGSWCDCSPPPSSTGLSPCWFSPPLSPVPQFLTIPANFPLMWHEARWGWWTLGHTVCSGLRMQWRCCRWERYVTVCPPLGIPEFHIRLSVQKIFPTVALKCNVYPFKQNKLGKKKRSQTASTSRKELHSIGGIKVEQSFHLWWHLCSKTSWAWKKS